MFATAATCVLKWKGKYVEDLGILGQDVTNFWHADDRIGVSMQSEDVVSLLVTKTFQTTVFRYKIKITANL